MNLWIDHVTQFVYDRDRAADSLRHMGLNATPGGRHPGVGSANNLCYFGLFYIEMLSVIDPDEALRGASGVCRAAVSYLESGEGLGAFAFETDDLSLAVEHLRAAGVDVPAPVRMQRVHENGDVSLS